MVTEVASMKEIHFGRKVVGDLCRNTTSDVVNGPHAAGEFVVGLERGEGVNSTIALCLDRESNEGSIAKTSQIRPGVPDHSLYAAAVFGAERFPVIGECSLDADTMFVPPVNGPHMRRAIKIRWRDRKVFMHN